jgi:hypothetical protein
MGWTINVARPSAIRVVLLLIAILAVPIFIVAAQGARTGAILVTATVTIPVVCLICAPIYHQHQGQVERIDASFRGMDQVKDSIFYIVYVTDVNNSCFLGLNTSFIE